MHAITRALVASAFAFSAVSAYAGIYTIDFHGNGLSDPYTVDHFDTSNVDFHSSMPALNIVEPHLTFGGLVFSGTGNTFGMHMLTEPLQSVALNLVLLSSLEFSTGLAEKGIIDGFGAKSVSNVVELDATFSGETAKVIFETFDDVPFVSLSWNFTSPQYNFRDPETGEITTSYALYGLDSVRFVTVESPIPEPETYAMMLAGLGLLGMKFKRKQKSSSGGGLVQN